MMRYGSRLTPMVKNIIIFNIAIFLIQNLGRNYMGYPIVEEFFSLHYISVVYELRVWQVLTYMFLHGGFWHLFLNMLALFFIGTELEQEVGSKSFLTFYLATGLGAGLFIFGLDAVKVMLNSGLLSLGSTVGASGAIFALIFLYSILFKERQVSLLLFFIIPITMRAKNLLLVSLGLTLIIPLFMGGWGQISHIGHIGGALSGMIFLLLMRKHRVFGYCYQAMGEWWRGLFRGMKSQNGPRIYRQYPDPQKLDLDETKMSDYEIENKIDELLDIIQIHGLQGLSKEEKKFLERVSYLYRHKFPG